MRDVRVAAVQFEHTAGDKAANFAKIRTFAEQAAAQGVEILAFPEGCITGYWFLRKLSRDQLEALAEPVPEGPSAQELLRLSAAHGLTLGAGLVERDPEGLMHNTYVVAMPDGQVKWHRKIHAFESEWIVPGDQFTVFDTPHGCRVGVLICYDCNIIENCRLTALQGADILLAPHQTGGVDTRNPHLMGLVDRELWARREQDPAAIEAELAGPKGRGWLMRWLPSRAHDNGMFLVFANGVGIDDDEIRTGNSMILDCYGRILNETGKAGDDLVVADLDASLLERCTGRRWIKSRRPELYGPLAVPTGLEQDTRSLKMAKDGI
jgi:predicted amidohydrolase